MGFAFPPCSEVVAVTLQAIGRGVPRDSELRVGAQGTCDWEGTLSDSHIPESWTDGTVSWHELLARAHSYPEAIHLSEGRTLLRNLEVFVRLPEARRSYVLALEDNAVVVGSFSKGQA